MTQGRLAPEHYFMGIAFAVRERANCHGNRVGAVIIREGRIISTGYNGTPEGMTNCLEGGCYRCANRDRFPSGTGYDQCICVHAEQNAVLAAARFGIAVDGATMYSTMQPCFGCLKEMLQAKIVAVRYLHPWAPSPQGAVQYELLQTKFLSGVSQLVLDDPRAHWAVSAQRENKPPIDETGHAPP